MCLGQKLSDRSLARYKAKGKKRGYIRVWKVVIDNGKKYLPEFSSQRHGNRLYPAGLSHARKNATSEQELIHAFRNKISPKRWTYGEYDKIIIECVLYPEWVDSIGTYDWHGLLETLSTKAIVMPAYPNRKVTVREFRAAVKGKKVKKYRWES